MIVIRRELPLTRNAGPVGIDLSHSSDEDSPFRVPCDLCSQYPTVMAPGLPFVLFYAAPFDLCARARSTLNPMAHMKPSISRATAVTTSCFVFPLANRCT
jgi:hypothetical protein